MRILVTGGAGYIGSITTRMLCDANHEVIVLDSLERGHRHAVDDRATRDWMDAYYTARLERGLGVAASVRAASGSSGLFSASNSSTCPSG